MSQMHFSATEYCDRIKYEFEFLQSQNNVLKIDLEKAKNEKQDLLLLSKKYYETAYFLNIQNHKQAEFNARLLNILNDTIKLLPSESQELVQKELETAKKITVADIERRIKISQSQPKSDMDLYSNDELYLSVPQAATNTSIPSTTTNTAQPTVAAPTTESESSVTRVDAMDEEPTTTSTTTTTPSSTTTDDQQQQQQSVAPKVKPISVSDASAEDRMKLGTTDMDSKTTVNLQSQKQVPRKLRPRFVYQMDHSVSSLSFSANGQHMYTGGKGCVKVWDVTKDKMHADIACLKGTYIRSCKLTSDEQTMVVCGETKEILVMDIGKSTPSIIRKMETDVDFHYALTITPDAKYCFSCFSTGDVGMWDLSTGTLVRQFTGHSDSVSSIDITSSGKLVTGSLDKTVRVWDWSTGNCISKYNFPAQIFTLGVCPNQESIVAVGLENSYVEVINTDASTPGNYHLHLHDSCILSLAYAPSGDWFVTGGKDKNVNVWKAPFGPGVVRTREQNSILSCHVSPNNDLIGTGSWDKKATLYEVLYE